jgi:hypothetical protein
MGATKAMERLTAIVGIMWIMWIMLFQEARYMHQAGQSLPPTQVLTLARPVDVDSSLGWRMPDVVSDSRIKKLQIDAIKGFT